jgi:hypothetical protein
MYQIQEVWVNAVLMPTGEVISGGTTIGYLGESAPKGKQILPQFVKPVRYYQLVPRSKSVADAEKKA